MTQEPYRPKVELIRGPLGTLEVAQGAERAVLLRTVAPGADWKAPALDAWAAASKRAQVLHHPSLLAVIDVSRSADALVIATEYVQGVPLSVLIDRARAKHRAIPSELAERVVLDLARSVASTQELLAKQGDARPLGWVHPESVLVTSGDDALISDVGLLGLDVVPEHPDILAFRAPELLDGRGPTPNSVVYSLGLLLWELLAGRNALGEGTTASSAAEVRRRALAGAIPRLDLVAPSAPALLVGIASQAIHRDPAERFPDISAFVETLSVRKRPGPGALVRFMNELCGDLLEAQRGAVVRPQVAAVASWRPTLHPGDEVPEIAIPRAPKAIGLAAFREPVAAPAVVIAEKPEPIPLTEVKADAPPVVLPPAPPAHAPQATLPLILVKKVSAPPPPMAPAIAAPEEEEPLPSRPRRRGVFFVLVTLIVGGAGALIYVAYQKQQRAEVAEPAATTPAVGPASGAPPATSVAAPAASGSEAPALASSGPPERAGRAPRSKREEREEREAREERRKKSDAGIAPSSTWGKVDEEEPPPNPKSDNPYVEP